MASAKARTPAGTRRVVTAFFAELDAIPESKNRDVVRAAQAMIRETLASRRARIAATAPKLRNGPHVAHRPAARTRPTLIRMDADVAEPQAARGAG